MKLFIAGFSDHSYMIDPYNNMWDVAITLLLELLCQL